MFLKNYDMFKKILNTNMADTSNTPFKREDGETRNPDMSPFNEIGFYILGLASDTHNNSINWYLILGTGNTQPTYTDYALSQKQSSNFTFTTPTPTITLSNDNKVLLSFSIVATWSGTSSITITEYGLGRKWYGGYNGTEVLLYKDLFSEGITFQSNESKTFTFNIELG